jgi:hypothetical protein
MQEKLPDDLKEIMEKLSRKKGKKTVNEKVERKIR